MKTLDKSLVRIIAAVLTVVAWLLAGEMAMIPERLRFTGAIFHWQVWVMAGAMLVAARDYVSEFRCRCCGRREDLTLKSLLKSREMLCRSCLTWDPGVAKNPSEFNDLLDALK